jgi:hypothetical protein
MSGSFRRSALFIASVTALVALPATSGHGQPPATPTCDGTWIVENSPSIGNDENVLHDVDAVSASDAWAVGWLNDRGRVIRTLIEHRDATTWTVVPSPNGGGNLASNYLHGVASVATNDVWAVGNWFDQSSGYTLTEHWDGTAWTIVPSPNIRTGANELEAVSASSTGDVWAVGSYVKNGAYKTLAMHWDGSTWTAVRTPNATFDNFLYDVVAITPTDAWAIGFGGANGKALTLHWDGVAWTRVANPDVPGGAFLNSIDAVTSDDVWAVGEAGAASPTTTLVERWTGTSWTVVPSPNVPGQDSMFSAIAVAGPTAAWAVGWSIDNSFGRTLVERWDGSAWSIVPSPNGGVGTNDVFGVTAASSNEAWLVGEAVGGNGAFHTLVEHTC